MGKIDEYASGRNDGLLLALKIVEEDCYAVHGANSKEEAVEKWNNRVEHLKERDQQIGYEKIFEEMQMNSLR